MKPLGTATTLLVFIAVQSLGFTDAWAQAPKQKEPEEIVRLRKEYLQKRNQALRPLDLWYQAQLEALQKKLAQQNQLDAANAVRGELESAREAASFEGEDEFRRVLLARPWSWANKTSEKGVPMTFKNDGTVSHEGMQGTWEITGPRDVTISISNGDKMVLRFNATLDSYKAVGRPIRGRRWR